MIRKLAQQSLILLAGLTLGGPVFAQCVYIQNCTLVWSDEFDGTSLDTTKWETMIGNGQAYGLSGWGNNELQYYRAENATVANGELTITAKQEWYAGYQYTSARLRTLNRGDFTYGRFEMRAKLPTGQGMWPAFWMLPTNSPYGGWAAGGEIDIMEMVGNQPDRIHGTIHYGGQWPENTSSGASTNLAAGTGVDWHTYAVEWDEGIIRWFVDGQLYSTRSSWYSTNGPFPAPFDVDFHLLLNLAVGGDWPGSPNGSTSFPQEYVIDYVRVYQEDTSPPGPTYNIVFDDMDHANPPANGWFTFQGTNGGGGIGPNGADVPPVNGGTASQWAIWNNSGGSPGYYGGFGRDNPVDISDMSHFSFWINPDAGQDYNLEINLQDDDNGDGSINPANDDEFQFVCRVSPTGPCAIAGGGWQRVEIPIADFTRDTSYLWGGNGVLDTAAGGNGVLEAMVMAVISNTTANATFRTDYWEFSDKIDAVIDISSPGFGDTLHPHHDGGPSSPGGLDDVVDVVVYGASTLVGDTEDLDTDLVDVNTLSFGPAGGNASASFYNLDIDSDGQDDAMFRFNMSDTGFGCTDTEGTLVGDLTSGQTFEAVDAVTTDCDAGCH